MNGNIPCGRWEIGWADFRMMCEDQENSASCDSESGQLNSQEISKEVGEKTPVRMAVRYGNQAVTSVLETQPGMGNRTK